MRKNSLLVLTIQNYSNIMLLAIERVFNLFKIFQLVKLTDISTLIELKEGEKMKRKNLIKLLIDNNLTQTDVSKDLGVTNQHFSKLINCDADPSFGLIEKFNEFCNERNIIIDDVWELWKKCD